MRKIGTVTILMLLMKYSVAAAQTLTFCHEDENAFPWVFESNSKVVGLDIEIIKLLSNNLSVDIKLVSLPWKRCLLSLKNGESDGAFASSYKANRLRLGKYPTLSNGKLDASKRIHNSGYSLYRLKGSNLSWNKGNFSDPKRPTIYAQLGYSIVDRLQNIGVNTVEVKGINSIFERLLQKESTGAALQTERADFILESTPRFKDRIEKFPIAISHKPYYLMLSFDLVRGRPDLAKKIWEEIPRVRESAQFKKIKENFLKQYGKVKDKTNE